jgi:hypothetical protein
MPWLKIYEKEETEFPEFYRFFITKKTALSIVKKLSRYFEISEPHLEWVKRKGHGEYFWGHKRIELPITEMCSLGLLLHEFSHHYSWIKYHKDGHRQVFWNCLHRVYRIAKEKNFLALGSFREKQVRCYGVK